MEEPELSLEFESEESLNLMIAADFGRHHRNNGRGTMVMSPVRSREKSDTTFDETNQDHNPSLGELSLQRTTVC
jgi:hypothetical protein